MDSISRKEYAKYIREQNQPFSLIFSLKKGGKKLERETIRFFPRDTNPEHVKKSIKSAIERAIEEV